MNEERKRLFFGWNVEAPWPPHFPEGRLLQEHVRHMTLAFLGQTDYNKLKNKLKEFPPPPFQVARVGQFTECLFLPFRHPNVVAWNIEWFDKKEPIHDFQKTLSLWLQTLDLLQPEKREWLPHVTLCRQPFQSKKWQKSFSPLPFITQEIHLYESLGNLNYQSLWHYSFLSPFEELDHIADIAFIIQGHDLEELFHHAFIALAFKDPTLLSFYPTTPLQLETLDDLIICLNQLVSLADQEIGSPFKAISFHGEIIKKNHILTWEMIVDV